MTTLYRKYRPSLFSEISGQQHILQTLTNAIKNSNISHAYLFTGPRGTGKTTTARIFAKTVNCLKPITKTKENHIGIEPCNQCINCKMILENKAIDLIEIDAASHTGVDNIRQLKEAIDIPPTNFKYKVYIIDEVHMLSIGAFNALLKTLEEPPTHAIFILATTEFHKIPDTIISRCQQFNVKPLTNDEIVTRLQQITAKEKIKTNKEALSLIAIEAGGGMRDAESLLGQIISIGQKEITTTSVQKTLGVSPKSTVLKLITFIMNNEISSAINIINKLQDDGINIKSFSKQLLSYCRNLMLLKIADDPKTKLLKNLTSDDLSELEKISKNCQLSNLTMLIALLQNSLTNSNQSDIPQLPLEMALIEYFIKLNPQHTSLKKKISNKKISPIKFTKDKSENFSKQETSTNDYTNLNTKKKSNTTPKNLTDSSTPTEKIITSNNSQKQISNTSNINTHSISMNEFLEKWTEVLEKVKEKSLSLAGVLKNCIPIAINNQLVIIKTNHAFSRDRLNNHKNKLTIEKIFVNIFKVHLEAKFLTKTELPKNISTDENNPSSSTKKSTDKSQLNNNELLYEAMKKIGGKIIKSK